MTESREKYSSEELLAELQRLREEHGSVTRNVVRENAEMCSATFAKRFGSFNEAKEEAGLETYPRGGVGRWENTEGFVSVDDYYGHICELAHCRRCKEDHPACLEFHHPDGEKEYGIGFAASNYSADDIYSELIKTVCLCANCHKKHHGGRSDFDASNLEPREWPSPDEI